MEILFWYAIPRLTTALGNTPRTSLKFTGCDQKAVFMWCPLSYHSPVFVLKTQWYKVNVTCCGPVFAAVFDGMRQQPSGESRAVIVHIIPVSKRTNILKMFIILVSWKHSMHRYILLVSILLRIHTSSSDISIHAIKLTNAKSSKSKNSVFRSRELNSAFFSWLSLALVVPQQENFRRKSGQHSPVLSSCVSE